MGRRESSVLLQGRASKHSHHVSQPTRIQRRSCKQSLNSQRETLRGPSASLPCVCAVHGRAEPRSKGTGATELVSIRQNGNQSFPPCASALVPGCELPAKKRKVTQLLYFCQSLAPLLKLLQRQKITPARTKGSSSATELRWDR